GDIDGDAENLDDCAAAVADRSEARLPPALSTAGVQHLLIDDGTVSGDAIAVMGTHRRAVLRPEPFLRRAPLRRSALAIQRPLVRHPRQAVEGNIEEPVVGPDIDQENVGLAARDDGGENGPSVRQWRRLHLDPSSRLASNHRLLVAPRSRAFALRSGPALT